MNLIFFGSDQYSSVVLNKLIDAKLDVSVVTDKHEGGSPVENLAKEHGLAISYYPDFSLYTPACAGRSPFSLSDPAIGLCASFDHLIPQDTITQFGGNLYNLHPSLLPQYRNVSPVQYALALGDQETGITLFRISPGIDDGEIIAQASETILESDTTSTLTPRLFQLGATLFLDYLSGKQTNRSTDIQEHRISKPLIFTKRLKKDSGFIEWPVLQKLLAGKKIDPSETKNELLSLRLNKILSSGLIIDNWLLIISDLLRSLTPWPGIWSLVPTRKGELRISLESVKPEIKLKLAGKPSAISLKDFEDYYL